MSDQPPRPIVISGGARSRAASFLGYGLLVGVVVAGVVLVLVRFTGSIVLAVVLVGLMLLYMSVMAWVTMRNIEGKR